MFEIEARTKEAARISLETRSLKLAAPRPSCGAAMRKAYTNALRQTRPANHVRPCDRLYLNTSCAAVTREERQNTRTVKIQLSIFQKPEKRHPLEGS